MLGYELGKWLAEKSIYIIFSVIVCLAPMYFDFGFVKEIYLATTCYLNKTARRLTYLLKIDHNLPGSIRGIK